MAEKKGSPSSSTLDGHEHVEKKKTNGYNADPDAVPRDKLNALFENPLGNIPKEQLMADVDEFCAKYSLMQYNDSFRKGALVAQNPHALASIQELNDDDRNHLEREHTHKWSQPRMLYYLVIMCSVCAAVQGMDETVNNGAQTFYLQVYRIRPDQIPRALCKLTMPSAIQHHNRSLLKYDGRPVDRPRRRGPLPGLRHSRVLAHCTPQQSVRPPRNNLHLLLYCSCRLDLGSCGQFMGKFVHRSVRTRSGNRIKVDHCPCLCRRMLPSSHPRCPRDDVADVDR